MAKERTEYHHRNAAITDALTGIPNRRGFLEQAMAQRAAAGANSPVAVLLFDIDHFKLVNDRFGHAVGDRTLQIFADTASAQIGDLGTVGRWGGDEFVAVLFDTSREIAATVGERIQHAFEDAAADIDGRVVGATVSTGVAFSGHGPFELPACSCGPTRRFIRPRKTAATASPLRWRTSARRDDEDARNIVTLRRRDAA